MRKAEISDLVQKTYDTTLILMAGGFVVALLVSFPLAIVAALREGSIVDQLIISGTLFFLSIPVFIMGILGILLFSFHLQWLPSFGPGDGSLAGTFRHMILPWSVLGLSMAALQMGTLRAALLDVLKQDYIFAAEARGFTKWRIIGRHAMRSALVPFLNVVGLQFGYMIVGSLITDYVFGLGGIGALLLDSVNSRDYPLAQTLIMLFALVFALIVLVVDIVSGWLDPRYLKGE
jgi:peptide/nickel transport system permease protein